jgi:hypothetical protein
VFTALVSLGIFVTTLQWRVNGSPSPYATDVGEIQNALPRWGTIHFTGYPQYTLTGSTVVTVLRFLGIQPSAGASLLSALWGAVAVGLLVTLVLELRVPAAIASLSSLLFALSTSMWVDASLAEVHTLSMAFTLGVLLLAVRYGRSGNRRDLFWLTVVFTQGVVHQRALVLLAPAVLVLVFPQLRAVWRNLGPIVGLAAIAPLTYLYLPLRAWQGADWTFGQPGTWRGFWAMVTDTKSERIVAVPRSLQELWARSGTVLRLLGDDLPILLLAAGLLGLVLLAVRSCRREGLGLLLAALPYPLLCLVIWEGRVSDALLATKLPTVCLATLGLAVAVGLCSARLPRYRVIMVVGLGAMATSLYLAHRPAVLAITRDPSAEPVIARVARAIQPSETPITFMALGGRDYWALAYAQAFSGELPGVDIVDHNADFAAILERGARLLTLEETFYQRPPSWWEDRLGPVHLTSVVTGIVEIARSPALKPVDVPPGPGFSLGNGISILFAQAEAAPGGQVHITVYWQAERPVDDDYNVAVHLLAHDPPQGPQDVLAQADRRHPVYGWYPTTRWSAGEIVRDDYVVSIPAGTQPVGLRVGMYCVDASGAFRNTNWLSLAVPDTLTGAPTTQPAAIAPRVGLPICRDRPCAGVPISGALPDRLPATPV